jgi:spectinomycin phosphotransferase
MIEPTHFIIDCLSTYYCIKATKLTLLPLGADMSASIYKIQDCDQKSYFVKLKEGHFDDVNIEIIKLLQKAGIEQLIMPIKTVAGKESYQEGDLTLMAYPFVQGPDGFSRSLTDEQWVVLGKVLRQVHETNVPAILQGRIRQEDFSSKWRDAVRSLYSNLDTLSAKDEIALDFLKFIKQNRIIIQQLAESSEELCQKACNEHCKFVLCHSDIHAGNVLLDAGSLYIVDWDDPILAPKERDLMFIGGGVGNVWNIPREEELFYQGYGQVDINWTFLAYYRYERIVQDIVEYAQELLLNPTEGKDRLEMYKQFRSMFLSKGVVDIAFATTKHVTK